MPAKKPQDHKKAVEPFVWESPSGETVTFKPFLRLPIRVFRAIRELSELDAMFTMIDEAVSKADRAVLDEQPVEDLEGIVEAWQKASGVTPGES